MKLLLFALAATIVSASAAPVMSEKIQDPSPNGKYALRITYDRALNELMLTKNAPPKGGIFSQTIDALAIVSVPGNEILCDMTDEVTEGGNEFTGITFLWSADSKWSAFYFSYPRVGYTNVYHLEGNKFELAHELNELEDMTPTHWLKSGVLEFEDGSIATFDGHGKFKLKRKPATGKK